MTKHTNGTHHTVSTHDAAVDVPPGPAIPPTSDGIAAVLGFVMREPLAAGTVKRLRKSLPGYASVLGDAGRKLASEEEALDIRGVAAADIAAIVAERERLTRAEAVLEAAYRAAYEQRILLDDQGINALRKIDRAVQNLGDRETSNRWSFLHDYLAAFNGGGSKPRTETAPAPAANGAVKNG